MPQFERHEDIPDPLEGKEFLLFPEGRIDLRVPQQDHHTEETTSPVEVAYAFFVTRSFGGFTAERRLLEVAEQERFNGKDFFYDGWGTHLGRAVIRTMLDPDRLAPINMRAAHDFELRRSSRFPNLGEERFFENFVEFHGVLANRSSDSS